MQEVWLCICSSIGGFNLFHEFHELQLAAGVKKVSWLAGFVWVAWTEGLH